MKKKLMLLVIFGIMLMGCIMSPNEIIINGIEDKIDAEEITDKFYSCRKVYDLEGMIGLFSTKYIKMNDHQSLADAKLKVADFLDLNIVRYGAVKKRSLVSWETKIVKASKSSSYYFLAYKNEYVNYQVLESFKMTKELYGRIRIIDYKLEVQ
ncbi:hypothetical protein DWB61_16165 [Ancylomarina euxinus]|uniref:Lipoprotein n=1 Tax=Ancylomarina euxinus TaxID=2283627 RepID=A0A425XX58_9BACT|nr:hypothetical protein [Ancylomarina euxinus]MCZ4696203.1 hypothetical protein [Ancylomarina euxinus]MUP16433.1 hypothetical protein [Ancylomarina euxinus]RRG19223.1 hypothetical protein DWB61_16165 [Ancylomarina euxinus]